MRDPNRIPKVTKALEDLWKNFPDWRFMQLICNIQKVYGSDMFYVEDEQLIEFINEMIYAPVAEKEKRRKRRR